MEKCYAEVLPSLSYLISPPKDSTGERIVVVGESCCGKLNSATASGRSLVSAEGYEKRRRIVNLKITVIRTPFQ